MKNLTFKVGDQVRVLQVSSSVQKWTHQETHELFQRCVGQVLRVDDIRELDGELELNVMEDGSQAPNCMYHTIWIEPECVELAKEETNLDGHSQNN